LFILLQADKFPYFPDRPKETINLLTIFFQIKHSRQNFVPVFDRSYYSTGCSKIISHFFNIKFLYFPLAFFANKGNFLWGTKHFFVCFQNVKLFSNTLYLILCLTPYVPCSILLKPHIFLKTLCPKFYEF
jgi:hypothetical protein